MTDTPADDLATLDKYLLDLWATRLTKDQYTYRVKRIHALLAAHERALLDSLLEQIKSTYTPHDYGGADGKDKTMRVCRTCRLAAIHKYKAKIKANNLSESA